MRISIPSVPETSSHKVREWTIKQAAERVAKFLQDGNGKSLIMTGAGVSVDSGISAYRGEGGHYTVHKTYRPIFYHEFTDRSGKGHAARQRYWSRSYLGFPPVRIAKPNKTHYSIAAAQRLGYVPNYITQNVDNLHHSATPSPSLAASTILELHGTLSNVVCVSSPSSRPRHSNDTHSPSLFSKMNTSSIQSLDPGSRLPAKPVPYNTPTGEAYPHGCGFRGLRNVFQDELTRLNPPWEELAKEMSRTGKEPKRNPDGDVDLGSSTDYSTFNYPNCPKCDGILKPSVIFFGESVPHPLRDRSFQLIEESNNFLLVGTSLATYSAFRLVKSGIEKGKEILLINKGPTRGDGIIRDENRIGLGSSEVLGEALKMLSGGKEEKDPVLKSLLEGGREKVIPKHAVVSS